VVRTCRSLSKLEGLAIEALSVGLGFSASSVSEIEAVLEQAMVGRPNSLPLPPPAKLSE